MARARYRTFIETKDGATGFMKPVENPTITVFEKGTTTPIAETIYAGDTGGTTRTNPFTGAADGTVTFFLDVSKEVTIRATGTGLGTISIDYERVHPSLPILMAYRVYHVLEYGALGDGSDQSVAINAAITAMLANTSQPGGILDFQAGDFAYDNPDSSNVGTLHQLQGKFGYRIRGAGKLATKLYPAVRSDEWAGKPFISLAGAHNCGIEDICLGITAVAAQAFPFCFLFLGQSPSNGSNALWFKNVRIEGAGKHGFYNYAVPSCRAWGIDVYNHECTEPTYADDGNVADGAAVVFSRDNFSGITAIAGYDLLDSGDADYSARSVSDWDWVGEIHDLTSLAGTANACGLLLYGATNMRLAGNISSNGTFIKIPATTAADPRPTDNIVFKGTLYREDLGGGAGETPLYAVLFSNLYGHGSPSLSAGHINLSNSRIDNKASDAGAAVFKAEAGWTLDRMILENWTPAQSYTGLVLDIIDNASNDLIEPKIDGHGFALSVGASGTITGGRGLRNVGTMTYGTLADGFPTDYVAAAEDLLVGSAARALKRLAIGAGNQSLYNIGGAIGWGASARSVLDAAGAMLYATAGATLAKLAIGTAGQSLAVVAGVPAWVTGRTAVSQVKFAGATTGSHNGTSSVNLASNGVTRNSAGNYSISWDADFADADYRVSVAVQHSAPVVWIIWAQAAGSVQVIVYDTSFTPVDPTAVHVMAFGGLA